MDTARFRLILALVAALLLTGGGWLAVSAQTDDDLPALTDAMDGGGGSLLAEQPIDAALVVQQYALGQFIIQALDPAHSGDVVSIASSGELTDSRTEVDAVIEPGGPAGQSVLIGCRAADASTGYAFRLQPDSGQISLWRLDAEGGVELESGDAPDGINPVGEFNRIGIECAGASVSGILNGETAITTSDDVYAAGSSFIGAGSAADAPGPLYAAFDNLEIVALVEPEPEATSTPESEEAESAEGGAVDPATLEAAVIEYALNAGPIAGPFVEEVTLTNGTLAVYPAGVAVSNFHTEVRFVVPSAPAGVWSIGFCYWVDPAGNCYDVFVHTDGSGTAEWTYARTAATGESEVLDSGPIEGLDLTPGASNFIGLSIVDSMAVIIVNSPEPAVSFEIEGAGGSGDVTRWLSFQAADPADATSFVVLTDEFYVWDLSGMPVAPGAAAPAEPQQSTPLAEETEATEAETPQATVTPEPTATTVSTTQTTTAAAPDPSFDIVLGDELGTPRSGTMEESDTAYDIVVADVDIDDFYATVTFVTPEELSTPWDMTIGFRDQGGADYFRLTIFSEGGLWTFYSSETDIDSGAVDTLLAKSGEENRLEVYADGEEGVLALNGVEFATVDLSDELGAGAIWITTATTIDSTINGRTIDYRDFRVFELGA